MKSQQLKGLNQKFIYSDAGLGCMTMKSQKMRNFKELWEINDQIKSLQGIMGWRDYPEFLQAQEDEVIITIEYCTNCVQHKGSTRHNEENYIERAQQLKESIFKAFPSVKVYLKPLLFEREQNINNLYLQRRIGAFEVQIYRRLQQNKVEKEVLFSKLQSKSWPTSKIINQIPKFLKKINLLIQLTFEEFKDINNNKTNTVDPDVKGIIAKLTPFREDLSQSLISINSRSRQIKSCEREIDQEFIRKTQSSIDQQVIRSKSYFDSKELSKNLNNSFIVRPASSYNIGRGRILSLTNSTIIKKSDSKLKRHTKPNQSNQIKLFTEVSDISGKILFRDVPLDCYQLSIEESYSHCSIIKKINLFEISEGDGAVSYIQLKKPLRCFLKLFLYEISEEQKQEIPIIDAEIQLVPVKITQYTQSTWMKESSTSQGMYELLLEPDIYWIIIKKSGYTPIKKQQNFIQGETSIHIQIWKSLNEDLEQQEEENMTKFINSKRLLAQKQTTSESATRKIKYLKPPSVVSLQVLSLLELGSLCLQDILTNEPIVNANVKIYEETTNKIFSYYTNEQGKCKLHCSNISSGKIQIEHQLYYKKILEYGLTKQLDLRNKRNNLIEMSKQPKKAELGFLIKRDLNFYILTPESQIRLLLENQQVNNGISHLIVPLKDLERKGIYKLFVVLQEYSEIQIEAMLPGELFNQDIPLLNESVIQYPLIWIFGSISYEDESNFNFIKDQFLIPAFKLKCLPSSIGPSPITQQITFLNVRLSDQYDQILVSNQISHAIEKCTVACSDGSVIMKSNLTHQNIYPPVCVLEFSEDNYVVVWENCTFSNFQDKKLNIPQDLKEIEISQITTPQNKKQERVEFYNQNKFEQMIWNVENLKIKSCIQVDNHLLITFQSKSEVTIINWPELCCIGYFQPNKKQQSERVERYQQEMFYTIRERDADECNLKLWHLEMKTEKPVQTQNEVSQFLFVKNLQRLIIGLIDGCLVIYTPDTLEQLQLIVVPEGCQFKRIINHNESIFALDQQNNLYWYKESEELEQNKKYKINYNLVDTTQLDIVDQSGSIFFIKNDLFAYTKDGLVAQWQNYIQRPNSLYVFLNEKELYYNLRPNNNETYLIILTDLKAEQLKPNFIDQKSKPSQNVQIIYTEYGVLIAFSQLNEQYIRIGLSFTGVEKKNNNFQMIYFDQEGYKTLPCPDFKKRQFGLWFIGVVNNNGKNNQFYLQNIITDGSYQPSLILNTPEFQQEYISTGTKVNELCFLVSCNSGLMEYSIYNPSPKKVQVPIKAQVSLLQQLDSVYICIGLVDGTIIVIKRTDLDTWVPYRRFNFNDKSITSAILMDGSILVTSSEDRRISLVSLLNGILETQVVLIILFFYEYSQEVVDKTYVISLSKFQKDQFASGFPDGRIKVWKKEKSGQKINIRAMRTVQTLRVKCHTVVPFQNNLIIAGGIDKGLECYNLESGASVRSYINGHSGPVEGIQFFNKIFITSGIDLKILVWNFNIQMPLKVFECQQIQKKLIFINEYFISIGQNGKISIWYEIPIVCKKLEEIESNDEK